MNRKTLFLLGLLGIGAVLAYRISRADFDWELFLSSLSNLRPGWLAASIILSLGTYFIRAARWRLLLAPLKKMPVGPLFWATILGFSAIYLLGRAAELARPVWLTRREHIPTSASLATIIVERFLDSLMLSAAFAWALVLIEVPEESVVVLSTLKRAGWLIGAIAAVVMVLLFILRRHVESVARVIRQVRFPSLAKLVEDFAGGLSALGNARVLAAALTHSAVLWIAMALQSWFMFFGLNFDFSIGAATLVMVALAIGSVAQIPGIGGGFQVAWVFCMTIFFRIPVEQATATALIAFVVSYAPTITVAVLYMLVQGISVREFRASIQSPRSETV